MEIDWSGNVPPAYAGGEVYSDSFSLSTDLKDRYFMCENDL